MIEYDFETESWRQFDIDGNIINNEFKVDMAYNDSVEFNLSFETIDDFNSWYNS